MSSGAVMIGSLKVNDSVILPIQKVTGFTD